MSVEKAKQYLKKFGVDNRVLEFDVSSATVDLAAQAVGCEMSQIAKTMSFIVNGQPLLIVMAGDVRIANSKFKERFHAKAKMIAPDKVNELIGHDIGGVCPFGINDGIAVYLDVSLKRFEYVYPAAGSGNSAIKLTIDELEKYSDAAGWVDIGKEIDIR